MSNSTGGTTAANTGVLTTRQAADYLQVSKSYIDKSRALGGGPAFFYLGRSVRYRQDALDAFIIELERRAVRKAGRA